MPGGSAARVGNWTTGNERRAETGRGDVVIDIGDGVTLHLGDCLDVMRTLPENSVDTVITDPPYGLSFMGKNWDHGIPGPAFWREALRVAKPGAMLLAFGGTRTHHRLMVAIEDAGWQIRDCIFWIFGSGFPKSHNLHKATSDPDWEGYGTA